MRIRVNGEDRDVADGATVASLLELLELPSGRVAVERNKRIVRRATHAETLLAEGDELEIVTLVGGG
jgi:sulfur carrier protein